MHRSVYLNKYLFAYYFTTSINFRHVTKLMSFRDPKFLFCSEMDVFVVIVAIFCISLSIHHLLKNRRRLKTLLSSDTRTRRVLFITAHPDDECMFFSPTVLSFSNSGQNEVFRLCLSTGTYSGTQLLNFFFESVYDS